MYQTKCTKLRKSEYDSLPPCKPQLVYLTNIHIRLQNKICYLEKFRYMPITNLSKYLLTYVLTPWSRVLLEKLTGFQLVKQSPAFYGNRKFITAFTNVLYLSLSWARSIPSMTPHPAYWRSIWLLFSHLLLLFPSGLFPSRFPSKVLCAPLLSPISANMLRSSHYSWFDHPNSTYLVRSTGH